MFLGSVFFCFLHIRWTQCGTICYLFTSYCIFETIVVPLLFPLPKYDFGQTVALKMFNA